VLYVAALRLAPLSLVQAAAAGGIGVLALGAGRLFRAEKIGVAASLGGLVLLGLSLGSHAGSGSGVARSVAIWMGVSLAAAGLAARLVATGAGPARQPACLRSRRRGTRRPCGGAAPLRPRRPRVPRARLRVHQFAFQRRSGTADAGWGALPTASRATVHGELLGRGISIVRRAITLSAFALVLVGAVALSRPPLEFD
jgi:hypothetical protein